MWGGLGTLLKKEDWAFCQLTRSVHGEDHEGEEVSQINKLQFTIIDSPVPVHFAHPTEMHDVVGRVADQVG